MPFEERAFEFIHNMWWLWLLLLVGGYSSTKSVLSRNKKLGREATAQEFRMMQVTAAIGAVGLFLGALSITLHIALWLTR